MDLLSKSISLFKLFVLVRYMDYCMDNYKTFVCFCQGDYKILLKIFDFAARIINCRFMTPSYHKQKIPKEFLGSFGIFICLQNL